jgi:hypothetical protein
MTLLDLAKSHNSLQNGMLSLVLRIAAYSVAAYWLWAVAPNSFLVSFLLFTTVFELAISPASAPHCHLFGCRAHGTRFWFYLACVLMMGVFGIVLVREATSVHERTRCENSKEIQFP